ncbi:P-loop containing nucleoside triphosphate hydrolase [Pseudocohnilembus persalinus]|uniref:p-loop containing nucleoside triphosphate hydrolase n=1 Tax=Pseudocohnilembus persalinus TaxID=266149 RepID=A0A0V0Q7D3_PSEPJ|nr:P-loop containing nucleoside triphosphate hydrolase [Pseudocohnilembus persalinus]|eukprot:KRW98141.1 P-loop containing nucleoside triphosphate hydrolase [Pseudocohnilembus persalinus]
MEIEQFYQNIETMALQNDTQALEKTFLQCLQKIEESSQVCKFEKVEKEKDQETVILMTGITGAGKSTFGNCCFLAKSRQDNLEFDFKKNRPFKSKASNKSVTQDVSLQKIGDFHCIDQPGYGDPNLKDSEISMKLNDFLIESDIIDESGLSGIVCCVMLNQGLRIQKSFVQYFVNVLQSFCYGYEEVGVGIGVEAGVGVGVGPRLNVVFTDFSRQEEEKKGGGKNQEVQDDEFDFDFGGEESGDEIEEESQEQKFQNLVSQFKKLLVEQIFIEGRIERTEDEKFQEYYQSEEYKRVERIVDKMINFENFYAYKIQRDKNQMDTELQQIAKLIQDNKKHGKWVLKEEGKQGFMPVFRDVEQRNLIHQNICKSFQGCQEILQQAQKQYEMEKQGQKCEQIEKYQLQMENLQRRYEQVVTKRPQVLLKIPALLNDIFNKSLNFLVQSIQNNIQEIIGDINESEINGMKKKIKDMKQQYDNQKKEHMQNQQQLESEKQMIQREFEKQKLDIQGKFSVNQDQDLDKEAKIQDSQDKIEEEENFNIQQEQISRQIHCQFQNGKKNTQNVRNDRNNQQVQNRTQQQIVENTNQIDQNNFNSQKKPINKNNQQKMGQLQQNSQSLIKSQSGIQYQNQQSSQPQNIKIYQQKTSTCGQQQQFVQQQKRVVIRQPQNSQQNQVIQYQQVQGQQIKNQNQPNNQVYQTHISSNYKNTNNNIQYNIQGQQLYQQGMVSQPNQKYQQQSSRIVYNQFQGQQENYHQLLNQQQLQDDQKLQQQLQQQECDKYYNEYGLQQQQEQYNGNGFQKQNNQNNQKKKSKKNWIQRFFDFFNIFK